MLELFCGTAGLTACFKRRGFSNSLAIDKVRAKFTHASILQLDVTDFSVQQTIFAWIRKPEVKAVFLAPPFSTASPAGSDVSKPLRSIELPDGLPGLPPSDVIRVAQANVCYQFTADCMDLCTALGKPCMVEHPKFSFLWFVTAWVEAESICDIYYQSHQSCAYGGEQPHWTCLAANFPHVCSVNQVCPGTHDHPTRGFVPRGHKRRAGPSCPTQYSRALCEAIVNAFLLALSPLGLRQGPLPLSANPAAQAATNLQPVKSRSPVFVPEYKCRLLALFDDSGACVWASAPCTQHFKRLHEFSVGGWSHEDICKFC